MCKIEIPFNSLGSKMLLFFRPALCSKYFRNYSRVSQKKYSRVFYYLVFEKMKSNFKKYFCFSDRDFVPKMFAMRLLKTPRVSQKKYSRVFYHSVFEEAKSV